MRRYLVSGVLLAITALPALAEQAMQHIPIISKGTSTYYVNGHIEGFGETQLLVDTGSGYTTINEDTLAVLKTKGQATFVKQLRGIMADGSRRVVQVYRLASLNIGGSCVLRDVEAAVLPASTRPILGINTLRRVSPFTFSVDPPSLMLSNCADSTPRVQPVKQTETTPSLAKPIGGNLITKS